MPQLRPYQVDDRFQLLKLPCMGCFNEQRTGKTPTSIMVMQQRGVDKLLIVCTTSALYQWKNEYELWADAHATVVTGTPPKRKKLIEAWEHGALIVSYDTLKTTSRSAGAIDLILKQKPQGIIADEAHRFKTPKSAVAKSIFKTIKIPYRLALTGTPCPNRPEEIYSILHWLLPEQFKSYWKFTEAYFVQYLQSNGRGQQFKQIQGFLPGKEKELQQLLASISTQRKRIDVMPWLPQKDRQDIKLPLTTAQTNYLSELEQYFEISGSDVITQGVLDRLMRYRQVCLAPALLNLPGNSPKLDWIIQRVKDYPDTPTIIFSKFTSFLNLLVDKLFDDGETSYGVITGSTTPLERAKAVASFQNGDITLIIINIDAGKEALTLDKAECCIFTDQYPPAADVQQAEDRFVATTLAGKDKPHVIIRLMMTNSYDEQMYKLVEDRASAIDIINDYKKYLKG